MGPRYLVRGAISPWFILVRLLGPAFMLGGVVLMAVELLGGIVVIAMGLALTVIVEVAAALARAKRCWIEVQDNGFVVIDRRGERTYSDAQVHALAYSLKNTYSNGELNGYTRTCRLWLTGEAEPVLMENHYKQNESDPLDGFIVRLIELLEAGIGEALEHGLALEGDGWRLTKNELFFRNGGREQSLRIEEIAAIESREGKMGVWAKGQEMPIVQLPVDGRNVWLLRNLVLPRLKQDDAAQTPTGPGLGRILFQRKPGMGTIAGFAIAGAAVLVIGLIVLLVSDEVGGMIVGGVMMLAGPLLGLAAYGSAKSNFRCHELGVYRSSLLGEQRMLYSEVASFSYGATRHYHNGVYTGTALSLRFDPLPGASSKAIQYTTQVKNDDADLDELRDFVSGMIANRMRADLAEGRPVAWTRNITFRPDGIEYTPSGFFGRKQTSFLPNEQYGGWNMDQGVFYLFQNGVKGAVMSEQVSEANFYPGFFMLLGLYHSESQEAPVVEAEVE